MKFYFKYILFVLIVIFIECTTKKENMPVSDIHVETPFQELDSTTLCYYQGSKLQWKLNSLNIKKILSDTGNIFASPVALVVYDSVGKEVSRVLSDSGLCDASFKSFSVWGNVFVKAQNGIKVRSNILNWNLKTHLITSQDYVQITTPKGDILRGKGLEAAEDFSWWKFKKDVSGRFPNFKERVEKGDEFY